MDEVKMHTKFTKDIIAKIIKSTLFKKTGYDVNFQIHEMSAAIKDETAHVHMSIDADIDKGELAKITKKLGL